MNNIIIKNLGKLEWYKVVNNMNLFNKKRKFNTCDEIWLVEHYPIFTIGKKNKNKYKKINNIINIPIMYSDRGGDITYHGLGQQIIYFLIDLKRKKINIKKFIDIIVKSIINTLSYFNIKSYYLKKRPGIYVKKKKICSLGLQIYKGYTSHGLALNVNMDLLPFKYIKPCGYKDLKMTQIKNFINNIKINKVTKILINFLIYILCIKYI
ncbi:Octanoyltransferase [Candidatus Annandia adelgestsuga]|uniref:Octanoyltransferase n=1 Tax=Candidatus Annandia adelgestsuga TaxID=1302411 RepID=A0A3Q9CKW4_9ENTR|nr:lipoyl(octanoyl) transferase LipB [Candidatus Annandia adelgestsuga]AZP36355.1 Octanoyltransferase [Candidatus Annandia adelgestsuga]